MAESSTELNHSSSLPHRHERRIENRHAIKAVNTTEMGRNDPMVVCREVWIAVVQSKLGSVMQPSVVCTLSKMATHIQQITAKEPTPQDGSSLRPVNPFIRGSDRWRTRASELGDFSRTCNSVSAQASPHEDQEQV